MRLLCRACAPLTTSAVAAPPAPRRRRPQRGSDAVPRSVTLRRGGDRMNGSKETPCSRARCPMSRSPISRSTTTCSARSPTTTSGASRSSIPRREPRPPTARSAPRSNAFAGALAARGVGTDSVVGRALPQRPGVRDGVPRDPACGRRRDHDQFALHRGRDREAAAGCRRHVAHHGHAPLAGAKAAAQACGIPDDHLIVLDGRPRTADPASASC